MRTSSSQLASDDAETRVGVEPGERWLLSLAAAVLLGFVVWILPVLARWGASMPWLPMQGPLELVRMAGEATPAWARVVIGSVIGAAAGLFLAAAATVITVSDRAIVISKGNSRVRVARSQVHEAAVENKRLVLRDQADVEFSYEKIDGDADRLAEALVRHGWQDAPSGYR